MRIVRVVLVWLLCVCAAVIKLNCRTPSRTAVLLFVLSSSPAKLSVVVIIERAKGTIVFS